MVAKSRLVRLTTRSVCGQSSVVCRATHFVPIAGAVDEVLGVKITDARVSAQMEDMTAHVLVTYTLNVWYAEADRTAIACQEVADKPSTTIEPWGEVQGEAEPTVVLRRGPQITGAHSTDGGIRVEVESYVGVEVTANMRVWVQAFSVPDFDDDMLEEMDDSGEELGREGLARG